MSYVYVSNADSGDISVLHMDPDGNLRLQSSVPVGGQPDAHGNLPESESALRGSSQ